MVHLRVHCVSKETSPFYFYDNFVRCRPIWLILDMIIGQSIYNVPVLSYLLETEILSIVEYQLKCCSVADNAVPDCRMIWSGAACCWQGHQRVTWTAARLCKSWWTTLRTFALSLWAANFYFGLILLFNFANLHFVIGTLSNCCLLYKVQLQHVKPGLVGWVTLNFRYKIILACVC